MEKNSRLAYLFFGFSFIVVVFTSVFYENIHLVYVKPLIPLALIFICISDKKSIWFYYSLSMLILMVSGALVYLDFYKYFNQVAITIILFYLVNIFLLRKYITLKDIKITRFTSLPIVISMFLVAYLVFSVSQMVLPSLVDVAFSFFAIMFTLFVFVGACFVIYLVDKYEGNFKLFVSASCCLFVNALLLINHFYYYSKVFTVLTNITEVIGLYFFLKFLMEVKLKDDKQGSQRYL